MHPYATDAPERVRVPLFMAAIALLATYGVVRGLTALQLALPWWFEGPSVLGFYGAIHLWFSKRGWRIRVFRRLGLVVVPDLQGRWEGELITSHEGTPDPAPVTVTVRQEWRRISVQAKTRDSRSHSVAATVLVGDEPDQLSYEYLNEPRATAVATMEMHRGTARLLVTATESQTVLEGGYYTGRGRSNTGTIRVVRTGMNSSGDG